MNIEMQTTLFAKYPLVLRTKGNWPLARYGIEVGDGWLGIIEPVLAQLEAYAQARLAAGISRRSLPAIRQIKEKMGTLRLAVSMGESVPEIDASLDAAEQASYRVCELCGAPGVGRNTEGLLRVTCDACESKPPVAVTAEEIEAYEKALKAMLRGRK